MTETYAFNKLLFQSLHGPNKYTKYKKILLLKYWLFIDIYACYYNCVPYVLTQELCEHKFTLY